jgi:hypothetical protein
LNEPTTRGRSAADIRQAYRLHEALIIRLAPKHNHDGQPCPEGCGFLMEALTAQTVDRHGPMSVGHPQPCPAHRYNLIMMAVPGFRCDDCQVATGIDCRSCGNPWPCEDVRVAQNACGLDEPGAADAFLNELSAAAMSS